MGNTLPLRKRLSLDEIDGYVHEIENRFPDIVQVESIGKGGGRDIWLIKITDSDIPIDNKEIVLILAMHTGMEITGGNAIFSLINYLLGNNNKVKEILKKQVVLLIPCTNPYAYGKGDSDWHTWNESGKDTYGAPWTFEGVQDSVTFPEAKAVQNVIDNYIPDAYMDCHGFPYDGQIMMETFSISGFGLSKAYNREFVELVNEAAEEAGYPQYCEDLLQKILPINAACKEKQWKRRYQPVGEGVTPHIYAYNKYHTLGASIEVSYEESGFLRLKKMLEIGNSKWKQEYYNGYPNKDLVTGFFHSIVAWGETPGQRRKSRVEIWNNVQNISDGIMHPEIVGRLIYVCSTSVSKCKEIFGNRSYSVGVSVKDFMDSIECMENFNVENMKEFMQPDPGYYFMMSLANEGEDVHLQNGYSLKVRIPYRKAKIESVLLNGSPLEISQYDGYVEWTERNWKLVQVNIPAGKELDLAVVMVKYDPCDDKREMNILQF